MNYTYETLNIEYRIDQFIREAEIHRMMQASRRNGQPGRIRRKTGALLVAVGTKLQGDNSLPARENHLSNGHEPTPEPVGAIDADIPEDRPESGPELPTPEEAIRDAVRQLPRLQQQVFILSIEHGFLDGEIADILGIDLEEAIHHLRAAWDALRQALSQEALDRLEQAFEWTAA